MENEVAKDDLQNHSNVSLRVLIRARNTNRTMTNATICTLVEESIDVSSSVVTFPSPDSEHFFPSPSVVNETLSEAAFPEGSVAVIFALCSPTHNA